MGVILRYKLVNITNKCQNCCMSVCSKLYKLCFCNILFELVYSWESYCKNKRVNLLLRHSVYLVFIVKLLFSAYVQFLLVHVIKLTVSLSCV